MSGRIKISREYTSQVKGLIEGESGIFLEEDCRFFSKPFYITIYKPNTKKVFLDILKESGIPFEKE